MIEFNKVFFMKLGILGFSGSIIVYMIVFFFQPTSLVEIIVYDSLIISFGILIAISLYLLSVKFGKNGIKIASVCILNSMILSIISELVYYVNSPPLYSLEYYNIVSFIYGLSVMNFILFIVNGMGFGFSLFALGREYSFRLFQITTFLWIADIVISFLLTTWSYLIFIRWIVYGVTCICIWKMVKIGKKDIKKRDDKIKVKVGFGRQ
jgi:hypothetical protein